MCRNMEYFVLGAILGRRTSITVTIAKSDFPNGEFLFQGLLDVVVPNPKTTRQLNFTIERRGGFIGKQTVISARKVSENRGAEGRL